jgi:general secretion pathway protein G
MNRRTTQGFTLIEMIIVLTLIGILVGLSLPHYQNSVKKARETVLKDTLSTLRKLIDQYQTDKGKYPASLQALVDENYLRKVPVDPVTGKPDTWIEVKDQPSIDEMVQPGTEFGIMDIKSGAEGNGLDGTPFSTW